LRKPQPGDLLRMRQDRAADHLLHHGQHLRPVPRAVKRLQLIDLVVHLGILEVALRAPARSVRDPLLPHCAVPHPAPRAANGENPPRSARSLPGSCSALKTRYPSASIRRRSSSGSSIASLESRNSSNPPVMTSLLSHL